MKKACRLYRINRRQRHAIGSYEDFGSFNEKKQKVHENNKKSPACSYACLPINVQSALLIPIETHVIF